MSAVPTCANGWQHPEDLDEEAGSSLGTFPPDPSDLPPLGDERKFAALLEEAIAEEKPRLFAIVQEYGERVDGRIAAWGMAFADHAEVVVVEYDRRMSLPTPEKALRSFHFGDHVRARLMWINPAVTPASEQTGQSD
ncbi:MAG TPA: hypothetical protein VGI74_04115 [Streptosporangiaceae bacterium]|jgi:hypothetical protein